ncbi:MAG: cysteine desulfurase [Thermofilaceae archaeon]|nr:cysteine desulfurase [Thermofilaceae archaeon]
MLDPYEIRKDFPLLATGVIYLDNAASSQKPRQVIEALTRFYETKYANIHRGIHRLSREASEVYEKAHETVARFINARDWREVIFLRNTTEAINLVAYSFGLGTLAEGDEVIVTVMEHHSNLLPWAAIAKKRKARVKVVGLRGYTLDYGELELAVSEKTKVVAVTHASNVLGTIIDARRIARLAHSVGAVCLVDGAQSVPHMPVNVNELECDFLAFSGHKMLGPSGIGVLWGRKDLLEEMEPFLYGGDMVKEVRMKDGVVNASWNELPWKFEAGTPNVAGAVGLAEAVEYLSRVGMDNIRSYEESLTSYALRQLSEVDGVEVYGPKPEQRCGILPFNVKGLDPHTVAAILDQKGIAVRSGFHCAQPLHEHLGLYEGTVRASFYLYNLKEEVDTLVQALTEIASIAEKASSPVE